MGNNLTQNILILLHKSIFVIFAGNFLCPSLSPYHAPRMEYSPASMKRGNGMNGGNAVFSLK